jgi:hypothetical protein
MVRGKQFIFILDLSWQMSAKGAVEPIQIVGSIHTIHTAGASAVAVETERRHASNDIRITDKVRSA